MLLEVAAAQPGDTVKCIAQDAGSKERRYASYGIGDDDRQALVAWALSPALQYLDVRHVPGGDRVSSVLGLWCERGAEQQVREFLGPLLQDAVLVRDTYYLRLGTELPSGEIPVADALRESLRVVERFGAVLHARAPWRHEPGSGRTLEEEETDELLMRLAGRTEPAGVARARARLEAARVPAELLSARDARRRIVEIVHQLVRAQDERIVTLLAVTTGAGKSTGVVAYSRRALNVRVAYLTSSHDVSKDMFGRFGDRPAVRRYGIISATDDAGAPLCSRIDTAEEIVERGGAPALLMCHLCPEAPDRNGPCKAFGGTEGSGRTTLVTVHQLVGVVGPWAHGTPEDPAPDGPLLIAIDEPPTAALTTTITRTQLDRALETLIAAHEEGALRDARKQDRVVRRRYTVERGPLIDPVIATRMIPALVLVRHMLALPADEDGAMTERLASAARKLIEASVSRRPHEVPCREPSDELAEGWLARLRLTGVEVVTPPPETDWCRLDPSKWLHAACAELGRAMTLAADGQELTRQTGEALVERGRHVGRALEAVQAVSIARTIAAWLAPDIGVPPAVVRVEREALVVTRLDPHLLAELRLPASGARSSPGSVVVLDATPDLPGLEAAAKVAGKRLRVVHIDVADGADVTRVMTYSGRASRKRLAPGDTTDWSALGPLIVALVERCERSQAKCVLVATHKPCAETLRLLLHRQKPAPERVPHLGARVALQRFYGGGGKLVIFHFGDIKGKNSFRCGDEQVPWEALDATATIGDHFVPVDVAADAAELLGLTPDEGDERHVERAAAESGQVHGRGRTPVRVRPLLSIHVGAVPPLGWHRKNSSIVRLRVGRPRSTLAMTTDELRVLIERAGSQRALERATGVPASTISRALTGGPITPEVAARLRAAKDMTMSESAMSESSESAPAGAAAPVEAPDESVSESSESSESAMSESSPASAASAPVEALRKTPSSASAPPRGWGVSACPTHWRGADAARHAAAICEVVGQLGLSSFVHAA